MAVSVATEHTARGWWLQEAEPTTGLPPLEGELSADLVVVGGGYTGMWTAWFVSELEPEAHYFNTATACVVDHNGGFSGAAKPEGTQLRRRSSITPDPGG